MAFRSVNFAHLARFNSATSSDFLDFYENFVDSKIAAKNAEPANKTFAPSSFRCNRRSWFRLRGVQPDTPKTFDRTLSFAADIGTACHRIIQTNLRDALGEDWIAVKDYLAANPIPYEYKLEDSDDGLETKVEIMNPPLRFACDGIIKWKGEYYLLEIKTSEFTSWDDLTDPKSEHVDQIKCYASILGIHKILTIYQDRQYGGIKSYEMFVSDADMKSVKDRFKYVQDMVEANLAPEALPKGDKWCTPSMCPYHKKCREWGN